MQLYAVPLLLLTGFVVADAQADPGLLRAPDMPAELERSRSDLDREGQTVRQEIERVEREAREVHARVLARGRAYARLGRAGLLPIGAGVGALLGHATRMERLRASLLRDLTAEHELAERRRALGAALAQFDAHSSALDLKERAVAQAHTALLEARDRELAFSRAFERSSSQPYAAVYGAGVGPTDPAALAAGFSSMKGRLPFPVTGRAEIRSARRSGAEGPALEMLAPLGTPVRAVYPGRVAFADSYPGYGKTVILDHGGGFYTVSANLDVIAVATGQEAPLGARLGTVGQNNRGTLLYFEIRKGTDCQDPAEWFGI
jgi:septal ring factor EnvC (AmiA/AmiB activator)